MVPWSGCSRAHPRCRPPLQDQPPAGGCPRQPRSRPLAKGLTRRGWIFSPSTSSSGTMIISATAMMRMIRSISQTPFCCSSLPALTIPRHSAYCMVLPALLYTTNAAQPIAACAAGHGPPRKRAGRRHASVPMALHRLLPNPGIPGA